MSTVNRRPFGTSQENSRLSLAGGGAGVSTAAGRKSLGTTLVNPPNSSRKSLGPSASGTGRTSLAPAQGRPSLAPSGRPSLAPSGRPSLAPSGRPSLAPGGRPSLAPSSGRPSMNGRPSLAGSRDSSANLVKQDPRPIKDKDWISRASALLLQFLTESQYDRPIAPKVLTSPSQQEYKQIVEFLFSRIDPNFRFQDPSATGPGAQKTGALEEVPALFKLLRYPFQMSKSSLLNVGSPHTWPNLLAALQWLVELLIFDEANAQRAAEIQQALLEPIRSLTDPTQTPVVSDSSYQGVERLFFDSVAMSYGFFLSGDDARADQTTEDFHQIVALKNNEYKEEEERLTALKGQLLAETEALVQHDSRVYKLQEVVKTLSKDKEKFKLLVASRREHKEKTEQKLREAQEELARQDAELLALQAERKELEAIHSQQIADKLDVDKIRKERSDLEDSIRHETDRREKAETALQQIEMQLSKSADGIEQRISRFNGLARRLGMLSTSAVAMPQTPATPKSRSSLAYSDGDVSGEAGIDGELQFTSWGGQLGANGHRALVNHDLAAIKTFLRRALDKEREKLRQYQEQLFHSKETYEQLVDQSKALKVEVAQISHQAQEAESEYARLRAMVDEAEASFEKVAKSEMDASRDRNNELKLRVATLQKKLDTATVALQEKKRRYESERQRYITAVIHIVDEASRHQEKVKAKITALLSRTTDKKRAFLEGVQLPNSASAATKTATR